MKHRFEHMNMLLKETAQLAGGMPWQGLGNQPINARTVSQASIRARSLAAALEHIAMAADELVQVMLEDGDEESDQ